MSEHHRHHRHQSRVGVFLRSYLVEIVAAVVVALGVFLLLERSLRSTLMQWTMLGLQGVFRVLDRMGSVVVASISGLTLTGALGIALIFLALAALVLRLRWRLTQSASLTILRCPRCGGTIHRVHRRLADRVLSGFVPVRRYRCSKSGCRWCGLRVAASQHGPEPTAPTP